MANPSDIIAAVATRMATVAAVGNVHQRHVLFHDEAAARAALAYTVPGGSDYAGQVVSRAWFIYIERTDDAVLDTASYRHRIDYYVVIRGFHGVMDGATPKSEVVFRDLVEAVMQALRADLTIGATVSIAEPPQARSHGHAVAGNILCHAADLVIRATRYPLIAPI